MNYIRKNISEIEKDQALQIYGILLGFLHVLAYVYWTVRVPVVKILDPSLGLAVCWPFFENCQEWRVLSPAGNQAILWIYLGLALISMTLFTMPKRISLAWWFLLGLNLFKAMILFQDYRLRLNQHYLTYWVTLAFLFLPDKRRVLQYLIVAFYFWAGTLKFTPEWISGAALYGKKPLGVPEFLVPASCVYVILFEMIIVFGLFAKKEWIFWFSFIQVIAFHIASWSIVGFFYPTLMLSIVTIFPLVRYMRDPASPEQPPLTVDIKAFFRGREPRGVYVVLGAFALFQSVPFAFPGDSSVTGEGRLFALHMFDAPLECKSWVTVHDAQPQLQHVQLSAGYLFQRIHCDPAVYFSLGNDFCKRLSKQEGFKDFDLHLVTRRWREQEFQLVIDQHNFCSARLHYDLWRTNPWILKDSRYLPHENKANPEQ